MDFIKNAMGNEANQDAGNNAPQGQSGNQQQQQDSNSSGSGSGSGGGFLGSMGNKLNNLAGGGKESEKNEDYLDKGIDAVQQYGLGQGKQDNESAVEQAKDEQISDFIRHQYKSTTGSEVPVKDKKTALDG